MNQPTLTIPKPCHENWEGMTPEDKGRFCGMCQKTVIDFTEMAPTEIGQFFQEHEGQKICGRFRDDQLAQPKESLLPEALVNRIATHPMGFRQMFVLALLVCMGSTLFSCNQTKGEPAIVPEAPIDTTAVVTRTTGMPVVNLDSNKVAEIKTTINKKRHTVEEPKQFPTMMGDVIADPETEITTPLEKEEPIHITGDTIVFPKQ